MKRRNFLDMTPEEQQDVLDKAAYRMDRGRAILNFIVAKAKEPGGVTLSAVMDGFDIGSMDAWDYMKRFVEHGTYELSISRKDTPGELIVLGNYNGKANRSSPAAVLIPNRPAMPANNEIRLAGKRNLAELSQTAKGRMIVDFINNKDDEQGYVLLTDLTDGLGIDRTTARKYFDAMIESEAWEQFEVPKIRPGRPSRVIRRRLEQGQSRG